ncbi:MFS transporter [Enterocloster bolteae]|uniref:MFS transporter n=1 Tax=Enterocloster bolteae TaxID=208479 RepID=UPI0028DBA1F2|nr:MFS transporter [Enterocloster bolteae]
MEKRQVGRRWIYLLLGTAAMVFTGFFYAWAILKMPLSEAFGWTPTELALNNTLSMFSIAAGNILAGRLEKKISSRLIIVGCAVLIFAGFCISSVMNDNVLLLYFSNAFLCGIGIGTFVVTIINIIGKWFEDRNGLSTSMLQMGLGFGGMLMGNLTAFLLDTAHVQWRMVYFILGALVGAVLLLTAFVVREPVKGDWVGIMKEKGQRTKTVEVRTLEMIRKAEFHHYYMLNLLVGTIGVVMMNFTNDYFSVLGCGKPMALMMVGCVSVSNGIGRFLIGIIYDWSGRMTALLVTVVSGVGSMGCLLLSAITGNVEAGVIGAVLAGASYGVIPAAAGPIVRERYGETYFASNYSVILTTTMPASVMATVAGAILTAGGTFTSIYLILFIFSLISCINYVNLRKRNGATAGRSTGTSPSGVV